MKQRLLSVVLNPFVISVLITGSIIVEPLLNTTMNFNFVKPNFKNSDYHSMIFIIFNMNMYSYFYTRANEEDCQLLFI